MFTLRILFDDHIIQDGSLRNLLLGGETVGWAVNTRFGYYRSLALSCIDTFALSVDGEAVDQERILFCLNGKRFRVDQLKDQYTEYWYLLDAATIEVDQAGGLTAGDHDIALTLLFRSPYMLTGPNRAYARIDSSDARTVALQAAEPLDAASPGTVSRGADSRSADSRSADSRSAASGNACASNAQVDASASFGAKEGA